MRKILFTLFIYISTVFHAFGLAVGTWQVYPSYANLTEISPAGDVCFALASGSLFDSLCAEPAEQPLLHIVIAPAGVNSIFGLNSF